MKKKLLLSLIPLSLAAVFSFSLFDHTLPIHEDSTKNDVIKEVTFHILSQAHFNQLQLDDAFSEKAFELYLKNIDNSKRFLLQSDVDALQPYKLQIDDEIQGAKISLFEQAKGMIIQRTNEVAAMCEEILTQPFDFSKEEFVELDGDKRTYCTSLEELKEEWRKYLKYQALVRYHAKLEEQNKSKVDESDAKPKKSEKEIEKEIREQLLKNYNNRFDALSKRDDEDHFADYMNAILGVFGPHTEYYPPQDKENFDIDMSGRLEGIGAQLILDDGNIKVHKIVPGSASWKQKELEAGDIILKVGQGDEEPVNIVGWSTKDAVKLIRGKKGTEVRLTVRKPDGLIKTIPIIRDVVILEESYAKSAIIYEKNTQKKYGVINLPSFYANFNGDEGGRDSGKDIKQELLKLKGQGVDGIVLDLRNNGGGSLRDAIEMAGLFINKGPVVQVKSRADKPIVLEDEKSGVIYDGPLVIMVNKFSASASEILAAAMQDYGRAIVIGSPTTFGKGTVQRFFDLDYYLPAQLASLKPTGSVKLTIQKFYRITGKSTQFEGVVPDILLPDTYSYMPYGERDLDYALPWDEIAPVGYKSWNVTSKEYEINVPELVKNSAKRVAKENLFELVEENAKRLKKQQDDTYQTLHYPTFKQQQQALSDASKKFKDLTRTHEDIEVKGLTFDMQNAELDSIKRKTMNEWFEQIQKDIYIYEAAQVLNDMVQ